MGADQTISTAPMEDMMEYSWMIPTRNDPLSTVRNTLQVIWEGSHLDAMLAPLSSASAANGPDVIRDIHEVAKINPFTPIMPLNAAHMVRELISNPEKIGAMLRPCEMRTLQAIAIREHLNLDHLVTISVDCLGTLPMEEFSWRAQRKGSPKGLAQEALQFARQGGIVPYRYRAACQICESPEANQADINIGIIGFPVRQYMLVRATDPGIARNLQTMDLVSSDPDLTHQHQRVVSRLSQRGLETRERIFSGLGDVLPADIESLVEPLQGCEDCRSCFSACPICTDSFPSRDLDGQYLREDVMEWLVSCSGCGMCEQSCPKHLPLTLIFTHIRNQLIAH
jgi:formate dehydrogenase subunit beta